MSNPVKQLRGQLRQLVNEMLPNLQKEQLFLDLLKHIDVRIDKIEADTKKTMHEMNERHKDTMGYLVRQVTNAPTSEEMKK